MRVAECLHIILLSSPLLCCWSHCRAHVHNMFVVVIDQLPSFVYMQYRSTHPSGMEYRSTNPKGKSPRDECFYTAYKVRDWLIHT